MKIGLRGLEHSISLQREVFHVIRKHLGHFGDSVKFHQFAHHALTALANEFTAENNADQGHAEISGLLEAVELLGADEFNKWKEQNSDVEIVHLNSAPFDCSFVYTIVYRKED